MDIGAAFHNSDVQIFPLTSTICIDHPECGCIPRTKICEVAGFGNTSREYPDLSGPEVLVANSSTTMVSELAMQPLLSVAMT